MHKRKQILGKGKMKLYQNGTGKTEEEVDNVLDFKQKE